MTWTKKAATAASALLFAAGGMLVTASPAAADGPCPANRLCIWDQPGFGGDRIISGSTNACFTLRFHGPFDVIQSYDNNLSVNAIVWHTGAATGNWYEARTLVKGGFSSNIGVSGLGAGYSSKLCMGNASPL
ncbi:peptidase inhibitor family I36 protein [Streptosporangium sp. NBC_01469]|uniref:peptidase inhibitor family I36 protein n=1 Tax=Streptosporangium sp. NBC_01469 TaxID=2903898 RepID=UPI002E2C3E8F|nr:peptidase inhibitor family I36 protein [Streptosporangium sp. NBC_01469]